jgi:hypothetical protein
MAVIEETISGALYGLSEKSKRQYRCYLSLFFSRIYPDLRGNLEFLGNVSISGIRTNGPIINLKDVIVQTSA